ncbi:MAG: molybdopterin synthase sulfur carrier subunit [Dehalococcoidia bacterium]|jgi:molybdopterin converting factor subunit 1|nr:MAG: molybdopterin synthase sulfur carrier subunit [Dehalococcoidia bacterium]
MQVVVRLFASARDAVGTATLTLELPEGTTAGALFEQLVASYPALGRLARVARLAVNGAYAPAEMVLAPGDEVAVLPPVSGG